MFLKRVFKDVPERLQGVLEPPKMFYERHD